MNEEEEKGKQKGGRRRDKHEQSTRAWSMENTQAYWQDPRVNGETECPEKARKVAGTRL